MKINYALQRASDNAWVSFHPNKIYKNPVLLNNISIAMTTLARCMMNNPEFGEIKVIELRIEDAEIPLDTEQGKSYVFIKALVDKLRTAMENHPILSKQYSNAGYMTSFVKMATNNINYRYAVITKIIPYESSDYDTKAAKKIAKFLKQDDAFLIKSDSDLVILRLHGNFNPIFVYDIQTDEILA